MNSRFCSAYPDGHQSRVMKKIFLKQTTSRKQPFFRSVYQISVSESHLRAPSTCKAPSAEGKCENPAPNKTLYFLNPLLIGFLSLLNGSSTPISTEHNQTSGNEPIHHFSLPFSFTRCLETQFSSLWYIKPR